MRCYDSYHPKTLKSFRSDMIKHSQRYLIDYEGAFCKQGNFTLITFT